MYCLGPRQLCFREAKTRFPKRNRQEWLLYFAIVGTYPPDDESIIIILNKIPIIF